jgi:transcriptional regulator with XRE-family HTH domain
MRRLRAERGLSQEACADLAEMDRTYVSLLEREKSAASLDMLERLANVLSVEPWELLRQQD